MEGSGFAIAGKRSGCDAIVIVGRAAALSTLVDRIDKSRPNYVEAQLLVWADRHRTAPAICLFHKGKGWQDELTGAMKDWDIACQPLTSVTDRDAVILRIGSYTSTGVRDRQSKGRRGQNNDGD